MENVMSKTNDTSGSAALEDHRLLADSEVALVSGGVTVKQKVVEHYVLVLQTDSTRRAAADITAAPWCRVSFRLLGQSVPANRRGCRVAPGALLPEGGLRPASLVLTTSAHR
jgi:hypothetical protein